MRRRQALHGVLALALPLAGCAGDPPSANGTATATDAPNQVGDTVPVEGVGDVTVTAITVQRAVTSTYLGLTVYEPEDGQVIVVETDEVLSVSESVPFVPRLDGERVDSPRDIDIVGYQPAGAVAVPVREAERAAVVLNSGSEPAWALPDEQVERLGAAPAFTLERATFDHEASELTLTVENSGDRDGTFRGGVDFGDDYAIPIEFPVAVGETRTESVDLSPPWDPSRDREFDVTAGTRVLQFDQ
jgi:hypothetical protein